jgi:hypothetical protein
MRTVLAQEGNELTLQISDELLTCGDIIHQNCLQGRQAQNKTPHLLT